MSRHVSTLIKMTDSRGSEMQGKASVNLKLARNSKSPRHRYPYRIGVRLLSIARCHNKFHAARFRQLQEERGKHEEQQRSPRLTATHFDNIFLSFALHSGDGRCLYRHYLLTANAQTRLPRLENNARPRALYFRSKMIARILTG